jgi:type I restriction enzyme M protein
MISIRSNFFYTRSVPCELWFFNKNKPAPLKDKVLMLDARNVYRQVTRKIYDFAPEQLRNLTAIVWLYRGEQHKYLALMADYIARIRSLLDQMPQALIEYQQLLPPPDEQPAFLRSIDIIDKQLKEQFSELKLAAQKAQLSYKNEIEELTRQIRIWLDAWKETDTVKSQAGAAEAVQPIRRLLKQLGKTIPKLARDYIALVEFADKELKAASLPNWDKRAMANLKKELDEKRQVALDRINDARDSIRYMDWLFSRFPEAELVDVPGLVKLVDRAEIADNDWSLTPGRYVGVAPVEEDEEFDFESIISQIHEDLSKLNNEAFNLGKLIDKNYADLLK